MVTHRTLVVTSHDTLYLFLIESEEAKVKLAKLKLNLAKMKLDLIEYKISF